MRGRSSVVAVLLEAAEQWVRARGGVEMELDHWTFAGDPGDFYQARGYVSVRTTCAKTL